MEDDQGRLTRSSQRTLLFVLLIALALALALWTTLLLITGGIRLRAAGVIISSRNPVRPLLAVFALMFAAWRVRPDRFTELTHAIGARFARLGLPGALPWIAASSVLAAGIAFTGRAALAADAFGYVSQSWLWLHGELRLDQPFAAGVPWPDADWTFSPLGYRPAEGHTLVPTYPVGLPLLMAGARLLFRCGPYYVAPACGAMLVLCTWRLGRRIFDNQTGITAALLTAVSPIVLISVVSPMSDVPAAAFWTAALLAAAAPGLPRLALAGALAGVAIMIRPNLAVLAMFPFMLAMASGERRLVAGVLAYATAIAPCLAIVAKGNASLYGSPFTSGYGDVSLLFSWRYGWPNAQRYASWWWHAHSLAGMLCLVAVFRSRLPEDRRRAGVLVLFALAVVALYGFYLPFGQWFFLRFLLPVVPIAMLFSADACGGLRRRLGTAGVSWALAAIAVFGLVHGIHLSRSEDVFGGAAVHQGYVDAARYIDSVSPPRTVVLAMQHSGSIRYYSGRVTLRYDLLDRAWLDTSLAHLHALGLSTYAVLEDWEETAFRSRFATQKSVRMLDRGPVAIRRNPGGEIRVYRLNPTDAGQSIGAAEIPYSSRFECIDAAPGFRTPADAFTIR